MCDLYSEAKFNLSMHVDCSICFAMLFFVYAPLQSLVANPSLPQQLKDKLYRKLKEDKSNVEPMETVDLVCDKGEPSSLSRDQEHPPTHTTGPFSLSRDQEHPPTHTTGPFSLSRDQEHPPTHTTGPSSLSRDQEHPPAHTTVSVLQQLQKLVSA